MIVACTSDLHGFLPEIPDCDVCIIAGDIVAATNRAQEKTQLTEFGFWLAGLIDRRITPIGIAGNHDFLMQDFPRFARVLPWIYLEDSAIEFGGKLFWGTPWTPYFGGWAFNAPQGDLAEDFLREKYAAMPEKTDVVISHGPPAGILDRVGKRRTGSSAFNRRLQEVMPTLAVFGHIHHEYGVEQIEGVTCANVSHTAVVENRYVPANPPVVFNI